MEVCGRGILFLCLSILPTHTGEKKQTLLGLDVNRRSYLYKL